MTRTLILSSLLLMTACVNDSPLYVTGFFPLPPADDDGKCNLEPDKVEQYAGGRDLAAGAGYSLIVDLTSELNDELDTIADDQTLVTGKQRNTVYLDQLNLTYTVVPSSITLESESVPIAIVLPPKGLKHINMGLIGPKAAEKLANALPNVNDRADVRVKFTFSGNIVSGGKISSTAATFPISFVRGTLPTCPAGSFLGRNGPCGSIGGQDGYPICCDSDPSTAACD